LTYVEIDFKINQVTVDAYRRLGEALVDALRELAAVPAEAASDGGAGPGPVPLPADEHNLGKRQRQIVELPSLATDSGARTAEIAEAIDYDAPNTYTALQALARSQVVEQVPDSPTQRWRLVQRYREANTEFAWVAGQLGPEEWTTAADISIAVRGDLKAAEAIVSAGLSDRIRRSADGDPARRVAWDELNRRAAAAKARRRTMTKGALNYLQIPSVNLEESIRFYEGVFGWTIRRHANVSDLDQTGYPEFADSTGKNGGGFVLGRPPSREPGLLPCIAVDSIDETLGAVVEHGGEVVKPKTPIVEGVDWEAEIRDPAGNILGLFESVNEH
jgi:predicted enzyme related to lactoylglutathione lyase